MAKAVLNFLGKPPTAVLAVSLMALAISLYSLDMRFLHGELEGWGIMKIPLLVIGAILTLEVLLIACAKLDVALRWMGFPNSNFLLVCSLTVYCLVQSITYVVEGRSLELSALLQDREFYHLVAAWSVAILVSR